MLASRESGVLGFKMWPLGGQLKINSLPEMEDRKMCFCSNLIRMSLCDAFLEKPRTPLRTSSDVPFSEEQVHRAILSVWWGSLLRSASRSSVPSAATALSREKQRQYHSEGVISAWQVVDVSIYTSLQTALILGL